MQRCLYIENLFGPNDRMTDLGASCAFVLSMYPACGRNVRYSLARVMISCLLKGAGRSASLVRFWSKGGVEQKKSMLLPIAPTETHSETHSSSGTSTHTCTQQHTLTHA